MDKHLTQNESKLQDLLQAKDFSELNEKEVKFVLSQILQEDYILERHVILNASILFNEKENVKPAALILPNTQNKSGFKNQMPIYQTLLLVAATIILMLIIFPIHDQTKIGGSKTEYIVKTDTIKIEKEIVKYDTVYQVIEVEKPIYVEKEVYVESKPCIIAIQEEPRLLNVNQSINLPELTENSVSNKGKSLKDDNVSSLIVVFQ